MRSALFQYADYKGLALFAFNADLLIRHQNDAAAALIRTLNLPADEKRLTELFPELIGSEDELHAILAAESEGFHLAYVSRHDRQEELFYYDLTVVQAASDAAGILLSRRSATRRA